MCKKHFSIEQRRTSPPKFARRVSQATNTTFSDHSGMVGQFSSTLSCPVFLYDQAGMRQKRWDPIFEPDESNGLTCGKLRRRLCIYLLINRISHSPFGNVLVIFVVAFGSLFVFAFFECLFVKIAQTVGPRTEQSSRVPRYAEMTMDAKNAISHRGRSLQKVNLLPGEGEIEGEAGARNTCNIPPSSPNEID